MASTKDIARSVPERPSWFISPSDITGRSIQPIGRGGLGEVFTGTYFGSKVAIKQLLGTCNIDQLNEYRHRIDLWKQLSHPNILSLLGACDQDDDGNPIPPFMVSPFMPNGTLLDHVANNNVPLEEKLRLLHQVAAGIAYLHDHNVVHGGLKAANVLLDSGANAVVSDFGLSRIKHTSTLTDRSRNSSYGAPETLDDDELGDTTMKTDVYAFAITTYEVLNDAKPVWITDDGEALQDQAIEQTVDHGQRPQQIDGIPNDIWTLIERCWAQTPADRPTFEQIAAALD
ncbi:kinase-like domain-containing protein, partial [Polychytrium aggregatum]|uniref:kinase-like domain-containing protein n=1 Tax=Polychytrium aggregatum TaxID=110093 RepID=UPI0022FE355D